MPFPAPAQGEEGPPLLARARPSFLRAYLAAAAARELAIREKRYPGQIAAGAIARDDAEADLECWRVLVALFTDGSTESTITWAELELATSRALQRREEAVAEKPDDPDRIARRNAVWSIHERISDRRHSIDDLNRRLRERAGRAGQQAA